MIATTATRKATETMIPRSVKKLRRGLPLICAKAMPRTSELRTVRENYSCRSASTGSILDARLAGSMPNTIPVSAAAPSEENTALIGTLAGTGV